MPPTADMSTKLVGYLMDERRGNVAFTRASHCLIVIADADTIRAAPYLAKFVDYAVRHRVAIKDFDQQLASLSNNPADWYDAQGNLRGITFDHWIPPNTSQADEAWVNEPMNEAADFPALPPAGQRMSPIQPRAKRGTAATSQPTTPPPPPLRQFGKAKHSSYNKNGNASGGASGTSTGRSAPRPVVIRPQTALGQPRLLQQAQEWQEQSRGRRRHQPHTGVTDVEYQRLVADSSPDVITVNGDDDPAAKQAKLEAIDAAPATPKQPTDAPPSDGTAPSMYHAVSPARSPRDLEEPVTQPITPNPMVMVAEALERIDQDVACFLSDEGEVQSD